jgi:hypothetical protein
VPDTTRVERPDRAGLKTLVTYLPPDVAKRVKMIAVQSDRTVQAIAEEAIMQWLERNSVAQAAQPATKISRKYAAPPTVISANPEAGHKFPTHKPTNS